MKTVNKKSLLVIAITLVLSLSVGLTMAYFSDYNAARGGRGIALGGKTELHDDYDASKKTVVIANTGETDVIVRVAVYAPVLSDGQTVTVSGSNWAMEGSGDTAYWYYTQVLPVGQSTSPLTVNTEYMINADLGNTAEVIVTHESVQAVKDANGNYALPAGWADKVN